MRRCCACWGGGTSLGAKAPTWIYDLYKALFMNFSNTGSSSLWMAFTRIAVGIMFLFFAQYKLIHRDFAHGGYEKYVHSYVQESSVNFYKPVLNKTLQHPVIVGYTVGVMELLV